MQSDLILLPQHLCVFRTNPINLSISFLSLLELTSLVRLHQRNSICIKTVILRTENCAQAGNEKVRIVKFCKWQRSDRTFFNTFLSWFENIHIWIHMGHNNSFNIISIPRYQIMGIFDYLTQYLKFWIIHQLYNPQWVGLVILKLFNDF